MTYHLTALERQILQILERIALISGVSSNEIQGRLPSDYEFEEVIDALRVLVKRHLVKTVGVDHMKYTNTLWGALEARQ
ncbi:hypothetical protein ACQU0X_21410 [Pseudovibrio ascidiaceicola]|uniref:hypothetical protein n=1 Tax=Pseudovibrio ascidiaceicola TaxID=285279 RepID=UPI003D360AD7